ncbi:FAD-binding oxidoreductase [Carbonactinospora thermoautotrophica]|uniref:FAD-binding oxidoreductase n=1 Tax=Carbonactinospora thermoautotrophica TaxID=1469144 RepID=UPI002270CD18|nr:FAD-binding oxidoreductase [Carbonactinospora thermoautotrophica]MCX9193667.1 FAD-binding oxidoreductase [Carbonactinospora thermoautotrophica]
MAVLAGLAAICGAGNAREAGPHDAVAGVTPKYVAAPGFTEEVAAVLRLAADQALTVVPRGTGTKLAWGAPPRSVDLVLDTTRLARVVEHAAGDLVVVVEAGTRLDTLQETLAAHGQRLALDPPSGGTVGGTVAANAAGPLRLLYGTARDLLIGATVVRADGVVARAGGKVVKNVAGYDLGKLFTGSYGTLGVITQAVFRLHPLPAARVYVTRTVADAAEASRLVQAVLRSQLVPAALELDLPRPGGPATLVVLLEGAPAGVPARAETLVALLGGDARAGEEAPPWWGRHPFGPDDIALKIAYPIADLEAVMTALAGAGGLEPTLRGSVGTGVLHAGLPGDADPAAVARLLGTLRQALRPWGSAILLQAPPAVAVDRWGDVPALALMRRVKTQFDPAHRLSPGRFVGGI